MRRRLRTFSSAGVEHVRSAVLLRFLLEHYHTGVMNWINSVCEKSNMPTCDKPVRIHCETGSLSARRVFEIKATCQDFVVQCKDDGISHELTVHSGKADQFRSPSAQVT